jgi:hypothetical protein
MLLFQTAGHVVHEMLVTGVGDYKHPILTVKSMILMVSPQAEIDFLRSGCPRSGFRKGWADRSKLPDLSTSVVPIFLCHQTRDLVLWERTDLSSRLKLTGALRARGLLLNSSGRYSSRAVQ